MRCQKIVRLYCVDMNYDPASSFAFPPSGSGIKDPLGVIYCCLTLTQAVLREPNYQEMLIFC